MRCARVGIIIAIALAATAISAASAGAAFPEYKECAKVTKHTGQFTDSKCSEESATHEGNYGLLPGFGNKANFTAKAKDPSFTSEIGTQIECQTLKTSGELAGTKEQRDVVISFKGCSFDGRKCATAGAVSGTLNTQPLRGVLGYISKSPLSVGIAYSPEGPSPYWVEGACEGIGVRWEGAAVGRVKGDINVIAKEPEQYFAGAEGHQDFTYFEGGSAGEDVLQFEFDADEGWEAVGRLALNTTFHLDTGALMIAA